MNPLRVILLSLAVLAALVLIVIGLVFTSGFQTWAANRAVAGQPGMDIQIGRVSAGTGGVEIEQLRVVREGVVLTLPRAEVRAPLWAAVVGKEATVSRLEAKGWTLDLTGAGTAKPTETPQGGVAAAEAAAVTVAAFNGILQQLRLPVDLTLDGVDIQGEVILPAVAGRAPGRAKLAISGGGLATGREGRFNLQIEASAPGEDGGTDTVSVAGVVTATMDSPRTFAQLAFNADAEAQGGAMTGPALLSAVFSAKRTAAGEEYTVGVSSRDRSIIAVQSALPAGGRKINGSWKISVRDTDVTPFAMGRKLPKVLAEGEGRFDTDTGFSEFHLAGRCNAVFDRLEVLRPELSALGETRIAADFDVIHLAKALRVERLTVEIAGQRPIAGLRALQPFEINLANRGLKVADPTGDLVVVTLMDLRAEWAQGWLPGLSLQGGLTGGELVASPRNGGLVLRTKTPVVLKDFSLASEGKPLLQAIDLSIGLSAEYNPAGWQAEVSDASVRSGRSLLFQFSGRVGQLAGAGQPVKATGKWSTELPALLAQPVLAGGVKLAGGQAQGGFEGSFGSAVALQGDLNVSGLVGEDAAALPDLSVNFRASRDQAGVLTFELPLVIEGKKPARRSDLNVGGTLTALKGGGLLMDAKATSQLAYLDDLKMLAAAMPESPADAKPAGDKKKPDAQPFWHGLSGQLALALKQLIYTKQFIVRDVTGLIRIDAGSLKLEGLQAGVGEAGTVKLDGGTTFLAGQPQPYALKADLNVTNFETAPVFQMLDASRLPVIEARLDVTGRLTGDGANLPDLAERMRGELRINSKGGIFRMLSANVSESVQKTQSTTAAIGGLMGAITGKKQFGEFANRTQVVSAIAKQLAEIAFDQLSVVADRDAALNLTLREFSLIAPEVRLGGAGEIRHAEDVPLLRQALVMKLQLGMRGKLAEMSNSIGLLDKQPDSMGYLPFAVPLTLGGSLENPDTSELGRALLRAGLEKGGGSLLNLLNSGKEGG